METFKTSILAVALGSIVSCSPEEGDTPISLEKQQVVKLDLLETIPAKDQWKNDNGKF